MATESRRQNPFVVSGQGQEATQIGMAYAMKEGDISSPYYRDLAFVTYMGITPLDTMLSAFGKRDDINSGGKQMPSHFSHREKESYRKVHQSQHKFLILSVQH